MGSGPSPLLGCTTYILGDSICRGILRVENGRKLLFGLFLTVKGSWFNILSSTEGPSDIDTAPFVTEKTNKEAITINFNIF